MQNNIHNGPVNVSVVLLMLALGMAALVQLNLVATRSAGDYDCASAEFRSDYPRRVVLACRHQRLSQ